MPLKTKVAHLFAEVVMIVLAVGRKLILVVINVV